MCGFKWLVNLLTGKEFEKRVEGEIDMKKVVALALVAALSTVWGQQSAHAAKVWDDMSWWGNTGATPLPQPDTNCGSGDPRSCYWWWPKVPASNVNDQELWGNRGIVYSCWERPEPRPPAPPEPEPPLPPAPRDAPVFDHILFDFGKAVLRPEGRAVADQAVSHMRLHTEDTLVISGHTDNVGAPPANQSLGQQRAQAVKDYMVQMGISPNRIETRTYGETQPRVANDTAANRMLNRRAEFHITVRGD